MLRVIMPLRFRQSVIEHVRRVIHVRQMPQAQRRLEHPDCQNAGPIEAVVMLAAISHCSHDKGITETKFDGAAGLEGLVDFNSKPRPRNIDYVRWVPRPLLRLHLLAQSACTFHRNWQRTTARMLQPTRRATQVFGSGGRAYFKWL
jgi:hypothetical protein